MPRGGRRSGSAGKSYTNRTDLNSVRTLPATAATGQPYGEAGKQLAAQKIVPMGTTPVPAPAAPPAPMGPGPGELTALNAPSERPNEPLTHGLSIGAGAGSEVLPDMGEAQYQNARDLLGSLMQGGGSPSINTLYAYLTGGM